MRTAALLLALVALAACSTPTSFDARKKWGNCIIPILDQGHCGSCWDFASMEAFSDRACISGEASHGTIMSVEPILECSRDGCNGGNPSVAWDWVIDNGDATCTSLCKSGCAPYDSYHGSTPKCHNGKCDSGSSWPKKYTAKSFKNLPQGAISTFQTELENNGPLQACFHEYGNFQSFFKQHPDGIYTSTQGSSQVGGHCVKLIGWGTESGTDYWLLANSWSTSFADNGFFKFLRGKNLCNMEHEISEGFTSKQKSMLEAQGYDFTSARNSSGLIGGNWLEQENLEDDLFRNAAYTGLDMVNKKEGKLMELSKIVSVSTQSAAGINFDIKMELTTGASLSMRVHRSYNLIDWTLVDYAYVF